MVLVLVLALSAAIGGAGLSWFGLLVRPEAEAAAKREFARTTGVTDVRVTSSVGWGDCAYFYLVSGDVSRAVIMLKEGGRWVVGSWDPMADSDALWGGRGACLDEGHNREDGAGT